MVAENFEQIQNLTTLVNEIMHFPRSLNDNEIMLIYNNLTNEDKENLNQQFGNEAFGILLYQYKYPLIRQLANGDLLFIASVDDFITRYENGSYHFVLREFETNEESGVPSIESFDNIYTKVFKAAYLPENDNIVNVSRLERFIYKLMFIIEYYVSNDLYYYALCEYLHEREISYNRAHGINTRNNNENYTEQENEEGNEQE